MLIDRWKRNSAADVKSDAGEHKAPVQTVVDAAAIERFHVALATGRLEEAVRLFRSGALLANAAEWSLCADALSELQQWKDSIDAYTRALSRCKDNAHDVNGRARGLIEMRRYGVALNRALQLNPHHLSALQNRGSRCSGPIILRRPSAI
jgi:hypothetical protein